jgi:hypothetical protein
MKKWVFVLMTVFIAFGTTLQSQETAPLKLVQTITLPPDVKGPFDHFEVDVRATGFLPLRSPIKVSWFLISRPASRSIPYPGSRSPMPCSIAQTSTAYM